jgi:dihydrofolate synthase/folylpolyglutamate synthase
MTWKQALDYLHAQLPMFHRIGPPAYKHSLDNSLHLDRLLNYPHRQYPCIHIAGTNGKGSVANMLAAIFQTAGWRTGLYTSPHLKDFRERIRVNGKMISRQYIIRFIEKNRKEFEPVHPSFFEWTTALAFDYFRFKKTDIAIIETGMGGRLDSTNIITPVISVITNIGWDHVPLLGNSLQEIAWQKAGIIKPHVPVVIGQEQTQVKDIFLQRAGELNSPIFFASRHFRARIVGKYNIRSGFRHLRVTYNHKPYMRIKTDLMGDYQMHNVCTVLQTIKCLSDNFPISRQQVGQALQQVGRLTGFRGRWSVLSKRPLIIADTGHNSDGIARVIKQLQSFPCKRLHIVFGMVKDKDIDSMLRWLPSKAFYYFCSPSVPRGLDAGTLKNLAASYGLQGASYPSVKAAFKQACHQARKEDVIFIGGSTFVVAEVL